MSSPSIRQTRYLIPQILIWHLIFRRRSSRREAKATMQEINRARDKSLARIVPSQRAAQPPIGRDTVTDPTEPASPVPSGAKVRPRLIDIRKDLNTRRAFIQIAAEHSGACLNGMTWNPAKIHQPVPTGSQQVIIGDSLVSDLKDILVVGQTAIIFFRGASVTQVIKMIELQNDDRVDIPTLITGTK